MRIACYLRRLIFVMYKISRVKETLIKSLSDFIWIFIQSKESSDANSELFKEDDDEAMYKNPYEI